MKILIKFILRVMLLPLSLVCLGGTALLTFVEHEPDWEFWRSYNQFFIGVLPWSKY